MAQLHQPFSETEFENVQLISLKVYCHICDHAVIKCIAAYALSINSMTILQDPDGSVFWEAFPDHISPQWFLFSVNSSVALWITQLNSIYMLLYLFPCIQSTEL